MKDVNAILDRVDQFYSSAFAQLVLLTICVIGLVGAVVPLVVAFLQSRALTVSRESVEATLREKIAGLEGTLRGIVSSMVSEQMNAKQQEYEKKLADLGAELKKKAAAAHSGTLTVQGKLLHDQKNYASAAQSIARACLDLIECGDEQRLKRRLDFLNTILKELTSGDFTFGASSEKTGVATQLERAVEELTKFNVNGAYEDELTRLKAHIALAKARKPVPKQAA